MRRKALKAVLVANNIEFPRTHHIELLISVLKEHDLSWMESLDQAAGLTMHAVQARYPGISLQVTEDHFQLARSITEDVFQWAEEFIMGHP